MSPKKAEYKIANTGAIIINATKVANRDELFQFNKTLDVIDYQPTLSIIF